MRDDNELYDVLASMEALSLEIQLKKEWGYLTRLEKIKKDLIEYLKEDEHETN